jgi:hypothetical protein
MNDEYELIRRVHIPIVLTKCPDCDPNRFCEKADTTGKVSSINIHVPCRVRGYEITFCALRCAEEAAHRVGKVILSESRSGSFAVLKMGDKVGNIG